jgi:hypothetical protein
VPPLTTEHDGRHAAELAVLEHDEGLCGHRPLDFLAPRAHKLNLGSNTARVDVVFGQEKRERQIGLVETTRSVDARREPKRDILTRRSGCSATGNLGERTGSGARATGKHRQARTDERSVVAIERRDVANGPDGDEIEPGAHVEGYTELGANAGANREGQSHRSEALV